MAAKPVVGPKTILYFVDQMSQCAWYRCSVPGHELAKCGHEVGLSANPTVSDFHNADVIVFLRQFTREAHQAMKAMRYSGKRVIYDIDDALWDLDPSHPAYSFYNQPKVKRGIEACVRVADLVTTSTESLAEKLGNLNPRVVVLPNMLPDEVWPFSGAKPQNSEHVIVGWAGGHTHFADLKLIRTVVAETLEAYPNVEVVCAGFKPTPFAAHPRLSLAPWVPIEEYSAVIRGFDIGLSPLVDSAFNKSKSDLKALEYSMAGIPVVASKVEAYQSFVKDGETGFLVETPEQWREALGKLIEDCGLREKMGGSANTLARERLISGNVGMWLEAYGLDAPTPETVAIPGNRSPEQLVMPDKRDAGGDKATPSRKGDATINHSTLSECARLAPGGRQPQELVSIVILTFNKLELTKQCINRIRENTADYEIVIVDNASEDGTREWLQELEASSNDVVVVLNDVNEGFAAGCNRGFRTANNELVCLLNNDTEPLRGWLDAMRDAHVDGVGAVGAKLLYPDGTIQHAGVHFVQRDQPFLHMSPTHRFLGASADLPAANVLEPVPGVTAACFLTSKSVWKDVGGIDEGYIIANFEDVDFNLRIRDSGLAVIYQPFAVVIHHEHGSWDARSDAKMRSYFVHNYHRLISTWNERLLAGLAWVP